MVALALLLGGGLGIFLANSGVGVPSKTIFIAKADAVCGRANGPVGATAMPTGSPDLSPAVGTAVPGD